MAEKILLIRPYYGVNIHTDAQGEYGTILDGNDVFPDLPLITAATILEQAEDYEVEIIEAVARKMLPDELLSRIFMSDFDTAVIKSSAASIRSDLEVARQIKKNVPGCTVMIAGHAALRIQDWIYENTSVDTVIDEPIDYYIYRYVTGEDATINDLPSPDYSLIDYRKYTDDFDKVRLTVQSSRGCPMGCKYCPYITYYNGYEERDLEKVLEDLKLVSSLGADIIQFRDQYFTRDKERITKLCNMIIGSGLKIKWICETRLDSLDQELIKLMKEAGLFLVCFGIESSDDSILDYYSSHKGSFKVQKETIAFLKEMGILTMAFYIIGFPEDTWESLEKTYRYANELDSDIVKFNEFADFDLSHVDKLTPDVFVPFENITNTNKPSTLTRAEIRYIIELFSTMYTLRHDPLKKAYDYNHLLTSYNRQVAAEISAYEKDLITMSREIRLIDSRHQ